MVGGGLSDFDRMFDVVMSNIDLIDRFEGIIFNWKNAPWRRSWRERGVPGVLLTFLSCLTEHNVVWMHVSRYNVRGIDIERMLRRHGVKLGDRSVSSDGHGLTFNVKRRQEGWCRYLLNRYGCEVKDAPAGDRNAEWAAKYKVRDMPADHSKWGVRR